MKNLNTSIGNQSQSGAVLVVSLVILLVITLLGVGSLESTTLEMKMAVNNQNRQTAFQAAEAALTVAENDIEFSLGYNDSMTQDCTSGDATCFDDSCEGGLCFNGSYSAGQNRWECALNNSSPPPQKVWRDSTLDVWNTSSKNFTTSISGVAQDAKYIIEFLCFVERGDGTSFDASNPNNGAPLFRITSLAVSDDGSSEVMLQSTYRYVD